jgi:hypothetical protein
MAFPDETFGIGDKPSISTPTNARRTVYEEDS